MSLSQNQHHHSNGCRCLSLCAMQVISKCKRPCKKRWQETSSGNPSCSAPVLTLTSVRMEWTFEIGVFFYVLVFLFTWMTLGPLRPNFLHQGTESPMLQTCGHCHCYLRRYLRVPAESPLNTAALTVIHVGRLPYTPYPDPPCLCKDVRTWSGSNLIQVSVPIQ